MGEIEQAVRDLLEAADEIRIDDNELARFELDECRTALLTAIRTAIAAAEARAREQAAEEIEKRLSIRLNDYLCEMKPGFDDSMVGFNEAWDVMRKLFDAIRALNKAGVFSRAGARTAGRLDDIVDD